MTDFIVVLVTASGEEEAARIGRALVEERLAACVNIVKGLRSIYLWKGKVEDEPEVLILVKTRRQRLEQITARVKSLHSYTLPEIVALPVEGGSADYLGWIAQETE